MDRRTFVESLAGLGAGAALAGKAGAQEKRPEFTGPLNREKMD